MSTKKIPTFPDIGTLHGIAAQARAEPGTINLYKGWTRLTTNDHGEMHGAPLQGFYCAETQMLSHYEMRVNGHPVKHRLAAQLSASEWSSTGAILNSADAGNLKKGTLPKGSIEVRVIRRIDQGMTEWIKLKNNGVQKRRVEFELDLVSPMHDSELDEEMKRERHLPRKGLRAKLMKNGTWVGFRFEKYFGRRRHAPREEFLEKYVKYAPREGEKITRALEIRVTVPGSHPATRVRARNGKVNTISAKTVLGAREEICIQIEYEPFANGQRLPAPQSVDVEPLPRELPEKLQDSIQIQTSHSTLNMIIGQSLVDLQELRLPIFGKFPERDAAQLEGFIAGVPRYIGLFGRDNLITGWQSALFDQQMFELVLSRIGALQGAKYDDWRDEEPGRLPHERRINPAAELGETNRNLYYGDVTSTPFWILALTSLFEWRGDPAIVHRHLDTLKRCCGWILRRLREGKGFIYYAPAHMDIEDENRNQAWKDSGDAIVDEEGRICVPPLAVTEIQAYAYEALKRAADLFEAIGETRHLPRLRSEAAALKKRFNEEFWDEDNGYFVMGLHWSRWGKRRKISAKASNMGHCLITDIIDPGKLPRVVRALMADDLFSGWGVRTLSEKNPGFDPFSYHRGSVWPVENAFIAQGLALQGFIEESHRIITAQLSLAGMFQHFRLPEVFTGHARSQDTPVPGLYNYANLLQAWSVSSISQYVQTILGIHPRADHGTLYLDPHLPEWLEWVELKNLKVGSSTLWLRFWRDPEGQSHWEVKEKIGSLTLSSPRPRPRSRTAA